MSEPTPQMMAASRGFEVAHGIVSRAEARAESAERERDEARAEVIALREALREAADALEEAILGGFGDQNYMVADPVVQTLDRARALLVQETPPAPEEET